MRTRVEIINSKGTLKEVPPFLAPAQEAISDGVWETPSRFIKSEKNKNSQSENGIRGVWIIYALFKDPKVSYAAKAFHGRVTLYAGMNGECWAGQETLAEEMNLSARQIRRMAEELIIEGWMSQKRVGRKNVYIPYQVQHEPPDLTADINVPYQGLNSGQKCPVSGRCPSWQAA